MIFGDPDYNVGIKYGDKTYTKNFDEYIASYTELTKESMRVLKDNGNLFMLNYPKQNAHLRVKYLDNFYPLVNEYVWVYNTNVGIPLNVLQPLIELFYMYKKQKTTNSIKIM